MTEEQIKQNAEAYILKEYPTVPALTKCAIAGIFAAGAHSRDEEIEELKKSYHEMFCTFANKLEQLRNPWISVKKVKPKEGKDVIFMLPDGLVYRGFREIISIRDRVFLRGAPKGTNCYMISDVTHWMPIPPIKKGGEK